MSLEIGQRVRIDVFGMRLAGVWVADSSAEGMVVGLGPGVVTVHLRREDGGLSEVTVSPGRIERRAE